MASLDKIFSRRELTGAQRRNRRIAGVEFGLVEVGSSVASADGYVFSDEALVFFARLLTQPSTANKLRYDRIFRTLKAAGTLAKLDALYVPGLAPDQNGANQNLIQSSFPLSPQGSPQPYFVKGTGYVGAYSGASYLDTGFTPSTANGHYSANSLSFGAAVLDSNAARTESLIGGDLNAYLEPIYGGDNKTYWRASQSADVSFVHSGPYHGLWIATRTGANAAALYRNGTQLSTSAAANAGLMSVTMKVLQGSGDPDGDPCYFAFIGGGLAAADITALQAAAATAIERGIVVYGDSLAACVGVGDVASQKWTYIVGNSLARPMSIHGVGGETLTQIAARAVADTEHLGWPRIYWGGNNQDTLVNDMAAMAAMVAYQGDSKFLIVSPIAGSASNVAGIDALCTALRTTYPNNYVDVRAALAASGDGGSTDNADIAAGIVPTSKRSDQIHFNAAGYAVAAPVVTAAAQAMGPA